MTKKTDNSTKRGTIKQLRREAAQREYKGQTWNPAMEQFSTKHIPSHGINNKPKGE